jgi:hypothetical protein
MDGMQNRTERDIEGMNAKKWGGSVDFWVQEIDSFGWRKLNW